MTDSHRELLERCLIGFLVGALVTRGWMWFKRLLEWWDKRGWDKRP